MENSSQKIPTSVAALAAPNSFFIFVPTVNKIAPSIIMYEICKKFVVHVTLLFLYATESGSITGSKTGADHLSPRFYLLFFFSDPRAEMFSPRLPIFEPDFVFG